MLPVPGFSDCSWAECDVDRGQPTVTRNALERANLLLEGHFIYPCSAISPLVCPFALALLKGFVIILLEATDVFSFFISSFLVSSSTFSSFLASTIGAFSSNFSIFLASAVEAFSSTFSSFLGSVFSLAGLYNC